MVTARRSVLAIALVFPLLVPEVAGANPLGKDSLFEGLLGEWEGRGELTDAEGKVIKVIEKWTGKRHGAGDVEMSGDREWGDEGTHQFGWRYVFNPTTELIECEMTLSTSENPIRLEVQVNEVEKTITLTASMGEGESRLTIVNQVEKDGIVGEVSFKDAGGTETLSGRIEHRRPGKWQD